MKKHLSGNSTNSSAEIHVESPESKIEKKVSRKQMILRSYSYFQMKLDKLRKQEDMESVPVTQDEIKPFPLCNPVAEILKVTYF